MANYENDQPDRIITGSDSSDYITNYSEGTNATINALGGNDSVSNEGDSAIIDTGAGNDSIDNVSSYVSINGGDGRDYLGNYFETTNVTMLGGEGDDTINVEGAPQ